MSDFDVKALQEGLNYFTKHYTSGIQPLMVDGSLGKATRARVRTVKFLLGYRGEINSEANVEFRERMWHPNDTKYSTPSRIKLGQKRRKEQRKNHRKNVVKAVTSSGVTTYNGVPVAKWMVPYLKWAKEHGWQGRLNSGWRDPNYSRSLCIRMCGAASCPGKCAGLSSNHVGSSTGHGAVDVSDYVRFGNLMRSCPLRPSIFNALGSRDPVHFSASGN